MIMIPPVIDRSTNLGEKKVFLKLKDDPNPKTKNWIVYHSLNYPVKISKKDRKSYTYFGEADFVILIPEKGIINIEVKGWSSFSCNNGNWEIIKKNGTKEPTKSPMKQARDSKYEIQKYIKLKLNKQFPQEWMVIFTQCSFDSVDDDIEYSNENIIDTDGLNKNFSNRMISLSNSLKTGGGSFQIKEQDMRKLKNQIMRPNFEKFVKTPTVLKDSENELHEFTKEQLQILNYIDDKSRLVVTGSQGTGKSAIAEEMIKRESQIKDQRILFLNSNKLANEEMKFKLKDMISYKPFIVSPDSQAISDKNVWCCTFNEYLRKISYYSLNNNYSELNSLDFVKSHNYLIDHNINFLKDKKSIYDWKDATGVDFEASKFDLIVFDEMQNCYFYDRFYEFMDLILKKGLTSGKYCFLGDFKYQNLVSDEITISKEKLPKNNLIDFEPITLIQNVRNAKSISRNAPILSGLFNEYPYELAKSDQGEVIVSFSKSREEKIETFENIISKLHKDGVHGNDIVVLSNFRLENKYNFIRETNISSFYNNIVDLTDRHIRDLNYKIPEIKKNNSIYFATTSAFQGMESKIVIYVDPLESTQTIYSKDFGNLKPEMLAYNAMGRANTILYLMWSSAHKNYYNEKVKLIGGLSVK